MGKTIKSEEKEQRAWKELQHEKKAYIKRKQEEEDAIRFLNEVKRIRDGRIKDDSECSD